MGGNQGRNIPLTCTPHFKPDADQPWITMDSKTAISLWISPNTPLTLEDVAQLIENFVVSQFEQKLAGQPTCGKIQLHCSVFSMTFRQQAIDQSQMASLAAKDYVRDGEPFNLFSRQRARESCVIA